jgi:uncharacterized protein YkwD
MIGAIVVVVRLDDDPGPESIVVSPLGPKVGQSERLYPENDPWKAYLAPESICPGGEDRSAPTAEQLKTMACLLNWARERRGLPALPVNETLSAAARAKAEDIYRCSDFAHEACGKEAHSVAQEAGYAGSSWGENLYAGSGELARPRVAVDGWLNSAGHRENLFREEWTEQGIALLQAPSFNGVPEVALWVSHFGQP